MTAHTPPDYACVSADDFPVLAELHALSARRRIRQVHLHHTFVPDHDHFHRVAQELGADQRAAGLELCRRMWRFHVQDRDFADIAQHVSIDPCGAIWLNRNWDRQPASCSGFNGDAGSGPFMIETIGNFDLGRDVLEGEQRRSVICVIAAIQRACGLVPQALVFHNDMTDLKSCPGTGVDKTEIVGEVAAMGGDAGGGVSQDRKAELAALFAQFIATDFGALKDGPLPPPAR